MILKQDKCRVEIPPEIRSQLRPICKKRKIIQNDLAAMILSETAFYVACHQKAWASMEHSCYIVPFDEAITLLLRRQQQRWVIIDISWDPKKEAKRDAG